MLPFSIISSTPILPLRTKIKKMDAGAGHIALLYDNGELYTRGDGSLGRLGTGNTTSNYTSWSLVQRDIKDVWCGGSCTLIQKTDNTYWKVGGNGILGLSGSTLVWADITSFFSAAGLSPVNIDKIELGNNGIMVIDTDKSLYVAGRNLAGEMGSGNTSAITELTLKDTNVDDVSYCGEFSTYIKDNILYRSGYGAWNQRGDGSTSNLLTYTALTSPDNTVLDEVSISNRDIYYVYRNTVSNIKSLYVNGINSNGELGTGTGGNAVSTRKVVSSLDGLVNSIKTRYSLLHKTIVLNDGVYASGTNAGGQCGIGNTSNVYTFTKCIGLPAGHPQYMIPFNNYGTFVAINDTLYWCGIALYFTGSTGNQLTFIKLETPYN